MSMELGTALGQALREARLAAGLRQQDIADRIGVAGHSVSRWEQGKAAPRYSAVSHIATLTGTTVEAIERRMRTLCAESEQAGGVTCG